MLEAIASALPVFSKGLSLLFLKVSVYSYT